MVATAIYSVTMVLWKKLHFLFIIIIIIIIDPGTQLPGKGKITLCNTKSTKIKLE